MLPLCDRALLLLQGPPQTARELARTLGAHASAMHRVLRGLERQGAVVCDEGPGDALRWRIAPGVEVVYHAARVEVKGLPPRPGCRVIGQDGNRCTYPRYEGQTCLAHRRRGSEDVPGMWWL